MANRKDVPFFVYGQFVNDVLPALAGAMGCFAASS